MLLISTGNQDFKGFLEALLSSRQIFLKMIHGTLVVPRVKQTSGTLFKNKSNGTMLFRSFKFTVWIKDGHNMLDISVIRRDRIGLVLQSMRSQISRICRAGCDLATEQQQLDISLSAKPA